MGRLKAPADSPPRGQMRRALSGTGCRSDISVGGGFRRRRGGRGRALCPVAGLLRAGIGNASKSRREHWSLNCSSRTRAPESGRIARSVANHVRCRPRSFGLWSRPASFRNQSRWVLGPNRRPTRARQFRCRPRRSTNLLSRSRPRASRSHTWPHWWRVRGRPKRDD